MSDKKKKECKAPVEYFMQEGQLNFAWTHILNKTTLCRQVDVFFSKIWLMTFDHLSLFYGTK